MCIEVLFTQAMCAMMLNRNVKKMRIDYGLVFSYTKKTRNSSGDEIANVNFLYDNIVHALKIQ